MIIGRYGIASKSKRMKHFPRLKSLSRMLLNLDEAKRGIVTRELAIGEFNLRHNAATTCGTTTVDYVASTLGYLRYKRPTFNRTIHSDDSMVRHLDIRLILCFEIKTPVSGI
jgi:hypothetical protein